MLEDILESVFALSFHRNFAKIFNYQGKAVDETPSLANIHPARGGDIAAWRGVDCLLIVGRLAMPLRR